MLSWENLGTSSPSNIGNTQPVANPQRCSLPIDKMLVGSWMFFLASSETAFFFGKHPAVEFLRRGFVDVSFMFDVVRLFLWYWKLVFHLGVSKNNGTPKSSILIGFSIINHPFWGTPIFGNTHFQICNGYVWPRKKPPFPRQKPPGPLPCSVGTGRSSILPTPYSSWRLVLLRGPQLKVSGASLPHYHHHLGGGNSKIFWNFHPDPWNFDPIWLYNIFQIGWWKTTN